MSSDPISTTPIGPFTLGVNNRRPEYEMDRPAANGAKQAFLRSAVNVDITSDGSVRRRSGMQRVLAGGACHSFWSGDGVVGYYVDGSDLCQVTGVGASLTRTVMRADMPAERPVSFADTPTGVYYSDGILLQKMTTAGNSPAGVSAIQVDPLVTVSAGGSLQAGHYSLCFTFRNSAGEESASTVPTQVTVPANGKISVGQAAWPWPDDAAVMAVYMTPPDAETLMRVAFITDAGQSTAISTRPIFHEQCATLLLAPMPAGSIVRYANSRLLVAQGRTLTYSEPFMPGLHDPVKGYIPFLAPITVVEPNQFGVYVVADQTYWFAGDIAQATAAPVLPYGGVAGSGGQVPNDNICFWMSPRGLIKGDQNGNVTNLQEASVAVSPAMRAATMFRESDGMKQIVSSSFGADTTQMSARSFIDAEVIRKGTTL